MASDYEGAVPPARLQDVCIAGAGIIGLSLALELDARGLSVCVLDAGDPLAQASTAAAGMLAAEDPENPAALAPLSRLSLSLYRNFLARVEKLSGMTVSVQTTRTLQSVHSAPEALSRQELQTLCPALHTGDRQFVVLKEPSIDPRQLAAALAAAVGNTRIQLFAHRGALGAESHANGLTVETTSGPIEASAFVDCTGAWSLPPISPRKGQMLYVEAPAGLELDLVLRTPQVYIVPRKHGPNAGRILIGATIEDAGFDVHTHTADIAQLKSLAAELVPELADARVVESWAGLRPATPDELPILGALNPDHFVAAGHYRNGILLAPATARLLAQLLTVEPLSLDLEPYAPQRFPALLEAAVR